MYQYFLSYILICISLINPWGWYLRFKWNVITKLKQPRPRTHQRRKKKKQKSCLHLTIWAGPNRRRLFRRRCLSSPITSRAMSAPCLLFVFGQNLVQAVNRLSFNCPSNSSCITVMPRGSAYVQVCTQLQNLGFFASLQKLHGSQLIAFLTVSDLHKLL